MHAGYLRVEVGADQGIAHCDPAGPDVVVLPKQLQSPSALRAHSAFSRLFWFNSYMHQANKITGSEVGMPLLIMWVINMQCLP